MQEWFKKNRIRWKILKFDENRWNWCKNVEINVEIHTKI